MNEGEHRATTAASAPAGTWPSRTHGAGHVPATAERVVLLGRLVEWGGDCGRLVDASGQAVFEWAGCGKPQAGVGDIVALSGSARGDRVHAEQLEVLVRGSTSLTVAGSDWQRFSCAGGRLRDNLCIRAGVTQAIRQFFSARGFLEVETPQFVAGTGQEGHVDFFESEWRQDGQRLPGVLIPSPEHHMKRLLSSGFERIFQIARCFRNGERSQQHNPEFTMLEWYRAYATYDEVMVDVEELLGHVLRQVRGEMTITHRGQLVDVSPPWARITVQQAFARFAGVDLETCRDAAALRQAAMEQGCGSLTPDDTWEDGFQKLLVERVEPALTEMGPVFLIDYPVALGALARRSVSNPGVAERAEAYIGGLELANGFSELNDPVEQEERFGLEARRRKAAGMPEVPVDREFLRMLACGMPPAGGMALGVDRLVMLCVGARCIDDVIAFPLTLPRNS